MANRRIIKAIKSLDFYVDTAFFDEQDKKRIIEVLETSRQNIKRALEEKT